jgi:hypothetical protein
MPTGASAGYFLTSDSSGNAAWTDPTITTTLSNLLISASNSTLQPGYLYHITDAANSLYGGTEIILRALSNTELDTRGMGKFYNPIYSGDSNGVWDDVCWFNVSGSINGTFSRGETVTADNGAVGIIKGLVNPYNSVYNYTTYFTVTSGNWTASTSITGNSTGATCSITSVNVATYSVGQKVNWGGKVWTNLTGSVGSSSGQFSLDGTNWSEVSYNNTDYNVVWDEITYDIVNDFITSRRDRYGNIVEQSYANYNNVSVGNSIAAFQWGNENWVYDNYCNASYFEIINHKGNKIEANRITSGSLVYGNTFGRGFVMFECEIKNYTYISNSFYYNKTSLSQGGFFYSTISDFSYIEYSELTNSFQISYCHFSTGTLSRLSVSNLSLTKCSFLSDGYISNLRMIKDDNSYPFFENLHLSGIGLRFSTSLTSATDVYKNKNLKLLETRGNGAITFTKSSTVIWTETPSKNIYVRSDGTYGISYLNASDVVVASNATS